MNGTEYPKIETLLDRDPKTFKVIDGAWRLPEFTYLKDNEWLFTEKVDGTNIRITWPSLDNVAFGGKTDAAQIPPFLLQRLQAVFTPSLLETMFPASEHQEGKVILYGEGYGARIQKGGGNYIRDGVDFVLFDVLVSHVEYDTIKTCPEHQNLSAAIQNAPTLLKDSANPATTSVLKQKTQSGQQGSNNALRILCEPSRGVKEEGSPQEGAISKASLGSALMSTMNSQNAKAESALFAGKRIGVTAEADGCSPSPLIIPTRQGKLEDYSVQAATSRSTKQNSMRTGSGLPTCTCKTRNWWLQRANVEDVADKLGIRVVPVVGSGTLAEAVSLTKGGFLSTWGEFKAEGLVVRPKVDLLLRNGERVIGKIKTKDF